MENKKGFAEKLDNFFGIKKSGSNFKTEIVAGITTFMAMVYILMVNASMFADIGISASLFNWNVGTAPSYGAMYIATAIGAIIGTMLMAFLAKMPLAQASGMGVNAFIVYTLCSAFGETFGGLTYANCMMFTLIDGVIFIILTATGLRKTIFEAVPDAVKKAIGVGIGLFIAFIGLNQAKVVLPDSSTGVTFASFKFLTSNGAWFGAAYGANIAPFVCLIGVIAIAVLDHKKVKGSILWGLLGSAVLYYILAGIGCIWDDAICVKIFDDIKWSSPFAAFSDWGNQSVAKVFTDGFNFAGFNGGTGALVLIILTTALSLCMIDMFDTMGTLYGACSQGNLLDSNGNPLNMEKCMLSDAIATCVGAIGGTSTVTTFVESSSGVAAGGKTGFTALITALCFALAMFLSPIAILVPRCATATALVYVGVLMMKGVTKIDWTAPAEAIVAFLTFIVMCLGYSISKGIGIGILAYIIVALCTGKIKEIKVSTWVIGALYFATFFLT